MRDRLGALGGCYLFILLLLTGPASANTASVAPGTQASAQNCQVYFDGSAAQLALLAEQKRGASADKLPKFLDPKQERELAKLWKGELPPAYFQAYLPEGVTLVNHQLKGSEGDGIIMRMQQGGEFVSLRVEMPYRDKKIGFNITLSVFALLNNMKRYLAGEQRWLIGPEVTAGIDWGHGGGTNSTGSQTVDQLMNNLYKDNIASVAMDQPMHGEGYRGWFDDVDDYLRFRVAFIKRFVHPSVPMFMIGHSMGGETADQAFRRVDRDDIGLADVYRGFIPLSFVPDSAPGGTHEEKIKADIAMALFQERPEIKKRINPGDQDLGQMLAEQGKVSPLCGAFCLQLARENEWAIPFNRVSNIKNWPGKKVRALYITGAYDSLTVGYEPIFKTHLIPLPNMKLKIMGARVSRTGEILPTGHMIFDHLMPADDSAIANSVIREWLEFKGQAKGKSALQMEEHFRKTMVVPHVSDLVWLMRQNGFASSLVVSAYYHVPEFTRWMDARIRSTMTVPAEPQFDEDNDPITEEMMFDKAKRTYFLQFGEGSKHEVTEIIRNFILSELRGDGVDLTRKPQTATTDIKGLKFLANTLLFREFLDAFELEKAQPTANFLRMNEYTYEVEQYLRKLRAIEKDKKKSEGEKAHEIAAMKTPLSPTGQQMSIDEMDRIVEFTNKVRSRAFVPEGALRDFAIENIKRRDANRAAHNTLEAETKKVKATIDTVVRKVDRWKAKLENQLSRVNPAILADLMQQKQLAEKQLDKAREELDKTMAKNVIAAAAAGRTFDDVFGALEDDLLKAFELFAMASEDFQSYRAALEKAKSDHAVDGSFGPELQRLATNLNLEMDKLAGARADMEKLASDARQIAQDDLILMKEYVSRVLHEYFRFETVRLRDLLEDPNEFPNVSKYLEKALARFAREVWGHRPPSQKTGLY